MSNPRPQEKSNEFPKPTCARCGKKNEGRCLDGIDSCYGCGKSGHMMKDCLKSKSNVREGNKVVFNKVEDVPQGKNRFYAL